MKTLLKDTNQLKNNIGHLETNLSDRLLPDFIREIDNESNGNIYMKYQMDRSTA